MKIQLGVVGASPRLGWAHRSHLPALQNNGDFELAAVCTTNPNSAREAATKYGARLAFHDYEELIASPAVDVVAIVVRVPNHYKITKAAIENGKHVYTEWPLGMTTAQAVELTALAKAKGVSTAVGLQARCNPTLLYMKELVETGYVGSLLACHVSLVRPGVLERPSNRTWQKEAAFGANTLTIANGHTLDALRFVAGDFSSLSSVVATQVKQWLETDTGRTVPVSSPDNVSVNGLLVNGAVASTYVATIPWVGSGYRMDIYGDAGTLSATSSDSPQLGKIRLHGAQQSNRIQELDIPTRLNYVDPQLYSDEAYNVAQLYSQFAGTIRKESSSHPTFETAVEVHQLIDVIEEASSTGLGKL